MTTTSMANLTAPWLLAQQDVGAGWFPETAASSAGGVDTTFRILLFVTGICLAIIVGVIDLFLWKYRRRSHDEIGKPSHPDRPGPGRGLLAALILLPLALAVALFLVGFQGFLSGQIAPARAYEIQVEGRQWAWHFTYPNGYVSQELHVPLDEPVKLLLTSADVVHSVVIPAFRLRQEVVPGRQTEAWFTAGKPGEYPLLGGEYNGAWYDSMRCVVVVHEPGGFETWLAAAANVLEQYPPIEAGEILVQRNGCLQCHSLDGVKGIGPSLLDVLGRDRVFTDGSNLVTDEEYIRESIKAPQQRVVDGFQPVMPPQPNLGDPEIDAIIEYLKSLGDAAVVPDEAALDEAGPDSAQEEG
ncbi:MAG: c-type cytochrome [bacterium]